MTALNGRVQLPQLKERPRSRRRRRKEQGGESSPTLRLAASSSTLLIGVLAVLLFAWVAAALAVDAFTMVARVERSSPFRLRADIVISDSDCCTLARRRQPPHVWAIASTHARPLSSTSSAAAANFFGLHRSAPNVGGATRLWASSSPSDDEERVVDWDGLMEMDVVLYAKRRPGGEGSDDGKDENSSTNSNPPSLELGAVQEDGTIAPLSAWTMESAFVDGDFVEFLVDEEDRFPGLTDEDVFVRRVLDESCVSYGSRQVGGGKGPGNPHGEESELLYYVDRSVWEEGEGEGNEGEGGRTGAKGKERVAIVIKPELEILW